MSRSPKKTSDLVAEVRSAVAGEGPLLFFLSPGNCYSEFWLREARTHALRYVVLPELSVQATRML